MDHALTGSGKMTSLLSFKRPYLAFSTHAKPYQRADDVGYAITEFMWFDGRPYYPIGALVEAKIAFVRLSAGHFDETDEDNLDLIFRMREAEGGHFFEIVLRSNLGTAYGGWLWGSEIEVLDEFVNGHRVLMSSHAEGSLRFEYRQEVRRYQCTGPIPVEKAALIFRQENTTPMGLLDFRVQ